MLLLKDIRELDEVRFPSSINHSYKWCLLPYQSGNDSNDLLLMLIREPIRLPLPPKFGYYNNWDMPEVETETIECISLSRAGQLWSAEVGTDGTKTVADFVTWIIAIMVVKIKNMLLEVDIEDEKIYPFARGFVDAHSQDQGLHAIANVLTNNFSQLYYFSNTH